ncbi:MAG TPA: energy-coupling factor ABC transporter ATP-binding protein [Savagea sp.]
MDIVFQQVGYRYAADTPFETKALEDVNLHIKSGSFTALVGHTGSGKSTVLLHMNGLLKPTTGTVRIGETTVERYTKGKVLRDLRSKVGIVFQFPEHQLFEETVEKDIMFGPMNFGMEEERARQKAHELVALLGLPEDVLQKSPFDLSGGQMRRVAIAGVLAFEPEVLILDEPTAGLDPRGQKEIMNLFLRLHEEQNLTTILVTHSMEDAARYADDIVVMNAGTSVAQASPEEVFSTNIALDNGLELPQVYHFQRQLEEKLGRSFGEVCLTEEQFVRAYSRLLKERDVHA